MSYLSNDEVNKLAAEFIRLRKLVAKRPEDWIIKKYKRFQNLCMYKLSYLVNSKIGKYRQFSNYIDLQQDGFEALMLALETFKPGKGDFTWWANKYISTRIYRAANAHSTIRYPLKKAKEMQPYKLGTMPVLVDTTENPCQNVEEAQTHSVIMEAINELPDMSRRIILMYHEFDGGKNNSVSKISKQLNISRNICVQILSEAKDTLKDKLDSYYQEIA